MDNPISWEDTAGELQDQAARTQARGLDMRQANEKPSVGGVVVL